MVYSPTVWVNNAAPPIDAAHLNKLEAGVVAAATDKLKYPPPPQFNPTVIDLTGSPGNYFNTLTAGVDYIFALSPTVPRTGIIEVDCNGANSVRVLGGIWALNDGGTLNYHMHFNNVVSSVFVEGQEADMSNTHADFLSASGGTLYTPDVYFQNSRILNLTADDTVNHADIFQPQGKVRYVYTDKLTFSSNYQGFTIASDASLASAVAAGMFFSRHNSWYSAANAVTPNSVHYWLNSGGGGASDSLPYPIILEDVWMDLARGAGRSGFGGGVAFGIFPNPNNNSATGGGAFTAGEAIGAANASGSPSPYAYFPDPNMLIRGQFRSGSPPVDNVAVTLDIDGSGSFVAAGVGTNYQTPGYFLRPGVDYAA